MAPRDPLCGSTPTPGNPGAAREEPVITPAPINPLKAKSEWRGLPALVEGVTQLPPLPVQADLPPGSAPFGSWSYWGRGRPRGPRKEDRPPGRRTGPQEGRLERPSPLTVEHHGVLC